MYCLYISLKSLLNDRLSVVEQSKVAQLSLIFFIENKDFITHYLQNNIPEERFLRLFGKSIKESKLFSFNINICPIFENIYRNIIKEFYSLYKSSYLNVPLEERIINRLIKSEYTCLKMTFLKINNSQNAFESHTHFIEKDSNAYYVSPVKLNSRNETDLEKEFDKIRIDSIKLIIGFIEMDEDVTYSGLKQYL